jgi:hypothetical protein
VLDSFTVVDVKHLRSLTCDRYYSSLLRANAHSIQNLTLSVNDRLGAQIIPIIF